MNWEKQRRRPKVPQLSAPCKLYCAGVGGSWGRGIYQRNDGCSIRRREPPVGAWKRRWQRGSHAAVHEEEGEEKTLPFGNGTLTVSAHFLFPLHTRKSMIWIRHEVVNSVYCRGYFSNRARLVQGKNFSIFFVLMAEYIFHHFFYFFIFWKINSSIHWLKNLKWCTKKLKIKTFAPKTRKF